MVNKIRTINYLPEIFRTDTNRQFLDATLDVLTKQPELARVQGFIGSKYGYGISPDDKYVVEPSKDRRNYQLDPSVVFLKKDTQQAKDFINYPSIIQALKNQGAKTADHNRLFASDFYSWESFITLDKAVNYAQYYWLPLGPDAITLSPTIVYLSDQYQVNKTESGYEFETLYGNKPAINLLRGGTYKFVVDQDTDFWIQGIPGTSGYAALNSRNVLGVTNNGESVGEIVFTVPTDSEVSAYDFPGNNQVDLVTTLPFAQIDGQTVASIGGSIDGITQLNGKTLMFYDNGDATTQANFYNISVSGAGVITLSIGTPIPNLEKIIVHSGTEYISSTFFRNSLGIIELIPFIGNTLYYQDGVDSSNFGVLRLVETNADAFINVDVDIVGKKNYVSPSGVKFTNGLKVKFDDTVVPASYRDTEYYVEGVGSAIVLLPVRNFIAPESSGEALYNPWSSNPWDIDSWDLELYVPVTPNYLTISRVSEDYNAWTRSNRWFHQDAVNETIKALGVVTTKYNNTVTRALRPIIEFQGNLQLFNSGSKSVGSVLVFDTVTTDAFSQIVGQASYTVDGVTLSQGNRIVFSADTNEAVRSHVYSVQFVPTGTGGSDVISLVAEVHVHDNDQVYVIGGNSNNGSTWRYNSDTTGWIECQKKTQINQAPLFDIFNDNNISISNSSYYPGTDFEGTKLFSYTPGAGENDPVLGFPIAYSSVTNIGDISFTVNLNSDLFTYSNISNDPVTSNINIGYVHHNINSTTVEKKLGWVPAIAESVQYQVFEFDIDADDTDVFLCDIPAQTNTSWNNSQLYVNDQITDTNQYTLSIDNTLNTTTVTLNTPVNSGDKVTVLLLSDVVSSTAYYEIPQNLQNNPFNANVKTLAVGDLRNQYRRIFTNAPGVIGEVFGNNNIHDLGNLDPYGDAIIQNSSSLVLPGTFLRKQEYSVFDALQYNSREYVLYKALVTDLAQTIDYNVYQTPSDVLDNIISQINSIKKNTTAFFWSDMLYSGSPYRINTYSFGSDASSATFGLSKIYDFTSASYWGLAIYLNRTVDGVLTITQLLKDVDYTVSEISPSVTVNYEILEGDTITVREYNQTYGSYCPNTPTKLGLYPKFIPGVILDSTYTIPTYFIRGHDGSYTKLYGDYIDGQLNDFRDIVLLEFETRIYNNIKVTQDIPITGADVIPGQWRETDYTREEILEMYSTEFLNWVGQNRIDYKRQFFDVSNRFTYNYNQSSNKLSGQVINQGYWRGIYRWMYDSDNPAAAPWEMLGIQDKPDWWDTRYGAAPYTSDNTFMWQEISQGIIWNDGNSYIDQNRVRPGLLQALPVDGAGNLVTPFTSVVGNYDQLSFNRDWIVGDVGPSESSYLKSSSWPFDLMRILALTKPAKFFNLFVDRDLYKFSDEFQQFLYNGRYHLDPRTVTVYGENTPKHSYLNWIVDYVNQRGVDGKTAITDLLANIDVRLTYKMAGFSSKDYLRFLVEKATPNSKNSSLLIPDDSYAVLMYDNVPEEKITYSSVIIQRVTDGWTVWGNSQNKPYFVTKNPKLNGKYRNISVGSASVQLTVDNYDTTTIVPYGTVMYSLQAVSEFLQNYGKQLTAQGVQFENVENGIQYDWDRMVQEFLYWAQQSWEIGSTISVNPDARLLTVNKDGLVVQPLTIQQQNFVLNQNLIPLQSQDNVVIRENTSFSVKILSEGDSIAYTNLNLSSIEHAVVFDNVTVFNDVIYNLDTGLRQPRLLLQGYKSAEWNGYVDARGFIINEDNIEEWQPAVKYTKGKIVIYKNLYWTARKLIQPKAEFEQEDWQEIDYDTVKSGLLPNPSTMAYESQYYYDVNRANLELDADLLSFSLIGYRPRDYLAAADLSDITQINVYKNIVREKGTNLIANAFKAANFAQGQIDYDIRENWAIKSANFGGVLNSNFVEIQLDQAKLTGNPTLIGFTSGTSITDVQQTVQIKDIVNYERQPQTANFLPAYVENYNVTNGLASAGYVNLDDAKFAVYEFDDLNLDPINIVTLYRGDNVWIANHQGSWDVFTPVSVPARIIQAINSQSGEIKFTFDSIHGLQKDDLIAIVDFYDSLNRFYKVKSVDSLYEISVSLTITEISDIADGYGTAFKLVSQRYEQASDLSSGFIPRSEFRPQRKWIDTDVDNSWAVWTQAPVFSQFSIPINSLPDLGSSVAYTSSMGYLAGDSTSNLVLRYDNGRTQRLTGIAGFGKSIHASGDFAYVASNTSVSVYQLNTVLDQLELKQQIPVAGVTSVVVSSDNEWMYISNVTLAKIYVYHKNSGGVYQYTTVINGVTGNGWGSSIATTVNGDKLIVGAPNEDISSIQDAGAAYIYARSVEQFLGDGSTTNFTVTAAVPANQLTVYVNGSTTGFAYTLVGSTVVFTAPPALSAIVTISYGNFTQMARVQSDNPHIGGLFGISVDTNRYGAEILVGTPFELSSGSPTGIEGAVYRYTNGGQRYGVLTGKNPSVNNGDYIFIDGFKVTFTESADAVDIADQINTQTRVNLVAAGDSSTNTFVIAARDLSLETANNLIDVTGNPTVIQKLGFTLYSNTQIITDPNGSNTSEFGYSIAMNERDSLVVSGPTATRMSPCTFDYNPDYYQNDTIFDHDGTTFIDEFENSGVVYNFDYLPASNESIDNPGKYVFGQYIATSYNDNIGLQPRFGTKLAFNEGTIVVGSPNWYSSGNGMVMGFVPAVVPEYSKTALKSSSWFIDKKALPRVDVNKLNSIQIYNASNNQTLDNLDYIDPSQGKMLGVLETNIDYFSTDDPAYYATSSITWGKAQIGKVWLDTNTIRLLNCNQPSITYNAKHWGAAFPGSTADIYTWIESTVPPIQYAGPGYAPLFDRYVSVTYLDKATNTLANYYYFWVKNYSQVPEGKTLSPSSLSQYLISPLSSGISFLAPITTNVVALFNAQDSIQDYTSILHIGYGTKSNGDNAHQSWALIRDGVASDFLSGLPTPAEQIADVQPKALYLKLLDSFAGVDTQGLEVPDPSLPLLMKFGVSVRPRQSMFIDRPHALENYLTYANRILAKYPITEIRSLSYLNTYNSVYDTRRYWKFINWWADGYSDSTKPAIEVDTYTDLLRMSENTLQAGFEGNTFLEEGLIVRVKSNSVGSSETYIWNSDTQWTRIGLTNGTIEFTSNLWLGPYGWAASSWDTDIWDYIPSSEIRWIIRWLNEQCYINDLEIERNSSLILLFKYIQSESLQQNNYLPWLNKTSLIDVSHKVRSLLPYKKFQRDNQEFLSGYINEVKPFHVYIKDFVFTYDGLDVYQGNLTDFDLPGVYNSTTGVFETPRLVYQDTYNDDEYLPTDPIWQNSNNNQWFENYGLSINTQGVGITSMTQLAVDCTNSDTQLVVLNAYGMPESGTIYINEEQMVYDGIDKVSNTLLNVLRGVNETTPASHQATSDIQMYLDPVIVLDGARGYQAPPKISAYIDTTIYPEPREAAELQAVMSDDKIVSVKIISNGSGYAVKPELRVEGSIVNSFSSGDITLASNAITIVGHDFQTGDGVIYHSDPAGGPAGLIDGNYYYVRALDPNTIALYATYKNAVSTTVYTEQLPEYDGRVQIISTGTGTENTLTVTAKLECFTSGYPVRSMKIGLLFDRVSYRANTGSTWDLGPYDITSWDSSGQNTAAERIQTSYQPTDNMPGNVLSQVMGGVEYPNTTIRGLDFNAGAVWDIFGWSTVPWDSPGDISRLLDSEIRSPGFTYNPGLDPTLYDIRGGLFTDGYGPEELVAGVVTDTLSMTVTSNDADLSFRLTIDAYGRYSVHNTNPYTSTTMSANFVSSNLFTDVLQVVDASKLVEIKSYTVTTDASGEVTVIGPRSRKVTNVTISIPDNFTYEGAYGDQLTIKIPTAPLTTITVTVAEGNLLLVNSEFIGFTSIDLATNQITGLKRGLFGTITNSQINFATVVQSVLDRDNMMEWYDKCWDEWWYGAPTLPGANTTLATNSSLLATFLQRTSP